MTTSNGGRRPVDKTVNGVNHSASRQHDLSKLTPRQCNPDSPLNKKSTTRQKDPGSPQHNADDPTQRACAKNTSPWSVGVKEAVLARSHRHNIRDWRARMKDMKKFRSTTRQHEQLKSTSRQHDSRSQHNTTSTTQQRARTKETRSWSVGMKEAIWA